MRCDRCGEESKELGQLKVEMVLTRPDGSMSVRSWKGNRCASCCDDDMVRADHGRIVLRSAEEGK